jgi:hypothetical protein
MTSILRTRNNIHGVDPTNINTFLTNFNLLYNGSGIIDFRKENEYFIYVTFYYNIFQYTVRFTKMAGTGHFLWNFDIDPIGIIINE